MKEQINFYLQKLQYEMDPSDLFKAMNQGEKIIPLDTRQVFGYEKEHIPQAINIPHGEMSEQTTRNLDKTYTYACYCDGIGCNASTKGALNMTRLGFNVVELMGGIEWWKFDGYETKGQQATVGEGIQCVC